jgi:hypothetical protein
VYVALDDLVVYVAFGDLVVYVAFDDLVVYVAFDDLVVYVVFVCRFVVGSAVCIVLRIVSFKQIINIYDLFNRVINK